MPSTILSDNGALSGTSGVKTTGSNDGALQLQTTTTGGTATAALTIDTSQRVNIGTTTASAGGLLTLNRTPTAAFGSPILQIGGSSYTSGGYYSVGLGFTDATYTEPPAEIAYVPTSDSGGTKGSIVFGNRDVTTNTAVTERMRITSDGSVVVNNAGGDANIYLGGSSGTTRMYLARSGADSLLWNVDNGPVRFGANNAERVRISAAGGFSVGTTADPGAGAIYATGNITAYYSSDRKFKENVKDVDGALDKVCAIGSKTFDWTDAYIASKGGADGYFVQKSDFGVVAQDVQAVFPQAVRIREDGTLAVDYEKLATLAFGAIKELVKRVEALEAK